MTEKLFVIPAQAGIQYGLRQNSGFRVFTALRPE